MGDREQLLGLIHAFPNINSRNATKTSEATDVYNCIAWAIGETHRRWQADEPESFWPDNVRQDDSIEALVEADGTLGFAVCNNGLWEEGHHKLAISSLDGKVYEHAAKLIAPDTWSSKLGDHIDISHSLESIENGAYGIVVGFMKRSTIDASI